MTGTVISFPGVRRPIAVRRLRRELLKQVQVRRDLTPQPLSRVELALIRALSWLMQDRDRQIAAIERWTIHLASFGLDADVAHVDGLRHAIDGLAMLIGTSAATDGLDLSRKIRTFVDLPTCSDRVATALVACVEADRIALRLDPADLA